MSKTDIFTFTNPFTPYGVRLGSERELRVPEVRVDECGYLPRGVAWNFDDVLSPYWRLYWNSAAGSRVIVSGKSHALNPRRIVLLPEGLRFSTRGGLQVPHLWLHFTIFPHILKKSPVPIFIPVDAAIAASLEALIACWSQPAPPATLYHRSRALIHAVLACHDEFLRPNWPPSLESLVAFIQENLGSPLDNSLLARRVGRSVEGFVRWFRDFTQTTPRQYILDLRIRQAAQDLVHTEKSLEQIAEENGFSNRNYFTRIFAKAIGVPPAAFRRRRLKQSSDA